MREKNLPLHAKFLFRVLLQCAKYEMVSILRGVFYVNIEKISFTLCEISCFSSVMVVLWKKVSTNFKTRGGKIGHHEAHSHLFSPHIRPHDKTVTWQSLYKIQCSVPNWWKLTKIKLVEKITIGSTTKFDYLNRFEGRARFKWSIRRHFITKY